MLAVLWNGRNILELCGIPFPTLWNTVEYFRILWNTVEYFRKLWNTAEDWSDILELCKIHCPIPNSPSLGSSYPTSVLTLPVYKLAYTAGRQITG